jgi:hypothetical protein
VVPGTRYLEVSESEVRSTAYLCSGVGGKGFRKDRADCPDQSKNSATLIQLGVVPVLK